MFDNNASQRRRTRGPRAYRPRVAALLAATILGLAACGGSGDDAADASTTTAAPAGTAEPAAPTATVAPEDEALCLAAQRIAAGDAELQERLQTAVTESIKSGEIDPLATLLGELRSGGTLDGIAEAYGDLEAAAPQEQQENVRVLATFTLATFEDLEGLDTVEELQAWGEAITSDPDAIAAQEPAGAIGDYVLEHCGISLTN